MKFPWLAHLLQTSDSFFPTGAYAHSGGLEELVGLGVVRDAASLGEFLRSRLMPMLAQFELPYVGWALRATTSADPELVAGLDREFAAGKLCRETREASAQIGAQRLRMLLRIGGAPQDSVAAAYSRKIDAGEAHGHAAIVWGVQAGMLGIPREAAWSAYCSQTLSGYCSAAVKLIRIGQESCQCVLWDALQDVETTLERAAHVEREDAGWCDPLWEIASARHERAFARLFIS